MNEAEYEQYRKLLDSDRKEEIVSQRDILDGSGKVLEGLGVQDPNKQLYDDSNYVSPFEEATDLSMPYIRTQEMAPARDPQSTRGPAGVVDEILFGKQDAAQIPMLTPAKLSTEVQSANVPKLSDMSTKNGGASRVGVPNPQSTAPQIIPEQGLGNQMARTDATIDENLAGAPGYFDVQKQKYNAKISAEEADAAGQMISQGEQKKKIEEQIAETEQNYLKAKAEAQKQIDSLQAIDPDRMWKNKSTWAKIALVSGAALQGANGSDAGLRTIQNLINNDLQAQMKNLDSGVKTADGLLALLKPFADNKNTLMKLGNDVSLKMAESYGKYLKAGASRGAAPGLAIQDTMNNYMKPLLEMKNANNKNLLSASSQEQRRRSDDEKLKMDATKARIDSARLSLDKSNMSESDARRLEGATAMAISASRMEDLENDQNFDPTKVKFAISQYMQGKGIPSSLNPVEGEYVQNYANYFSYKRQALTGAAASDKEEERIKLLVAPDKTFSKKSIKLYQAMRGKDINGAINAMNPSALSRIQNIPEFKRFDINRGKMGK
jgi:hypothetical protein